MNMSTPENTVQWLFLDLNAFFASCEQQERVELRGKPIVIVQTMNDSATAIATSYAAKRFGIKTGTNVRDAKKLCPDVIQVHARHKIYTDYHELILKAVDTVLPIAKVESIDEMACRLMGPQQQIPEARQLAMKVKQAIREQVGECMTCSVGLAPNIFLGKVASDLQKPDGLVVLTKKNLPGPLLKMKLQDIYGIGPRMEQRLHSHGITSVEQLWQTPSSHLRRVWGGIGGVLFHSTLHGADIERPSSLYSKSMSHQHVLEPELRSRAGAKNFSHHLLTKVCERLRRKCYYCRRLGLNMHWINGSGGFWNETGFHETDDTQFLLSRLEELWQTAPADKPIIVCVVLMGLVPMAKHQPDLFAVNPRRQKLSPLIDTINNRYGRCTIGFGLPPPEVRKFKGHAAFQRVPEAWEF